MMTMAATAAFPASLPARLKPVEERQPAEPAVIFAVCCFLTWKLWFSFDDVSVFARTPLCGSVSTRMLSRESLLCDAVQQP